MKAVATTFSLLVTFLVVPTTSADPIGGLEVAPAFCAAPTGGANAVADNGCTSCDGYTSKCGKTDAATESKCGKQSEASCKGAEASAEKSEFKTSCGGGEADGLDVFLGGLEKAHYACGCLTIAN